MELATVRNDQAAERRCALTKEAYQYARSEIDRSGCFGLPRASTDQAYLESQVMEYVASGNEWWAHPVGIAGIRIAPSELLVLLDPHTGVADGAPWPMTEYALDHLLPYAESAAEVSGAIGLRAKALSKTDLLLRSVGTSARVVLRGQPGTNWRQLLAERRSVDARSGADGSRPLWSEPELTVYERAHMADFRSVSKSRRGRAALGSALLRRIGLFERYSAAYSTKSWVKGTEWILEMESAYDAALGHDVLLDALTDPVFGLPLTVSRHHCNCAYATPEWETSCVFHVGHSELGLVQIRFRSAEVAERERYRTTLTGAKAAQGWLDRVLPPGAGRAATGERSKGMRGEA
jgi:hypothetical protein